MPLPVLTCPLTQEQAAYVVANSHVFLGLTLELGHLVEQLLEGVVIKLVGEGRNQSLGLFSTVAAKRACSRTVSACAPSHSSPPLATPKYTAAPPQQQEVKQGFCPSAYQSALAQTC